MKGGQEHFALDWIKDDLVESLDEARTALDQYAQSAEQMRMRTCLTNLHQVHGTLIMLELEGVSLLAEHLEQLAQWMLDDKCPEDHQDIACQYLMQGILEMPGYLAALQEGAEDQTGPYIPLVNDIRSLLGEQPLQGVGDNSLYHPASPEVLQRFVHLDGAVKVARIRAAFQNVLLAALKGQDRKRLLETLSKIALGLQKLSAGASLEKQWQALSEFVSALQGGSGPLPAEALKLLRRVDVEIKQFASDPDQSLRESLNVELMNDLLEAALQQDYAAARLDDLKEAVDQSRQGAASEHSSLAIFGRQAVTAAALELREEFASVKDKLDLLARAPQVDLTALGLLIEPLKGAASTFSLLGFESSRALVADQVEVIEDLVVLGDTDPDNVQSIASALVQVEDNLTGILSKTEQTQGQKITSDAQVQLIKEARSGLDTVKQGVVDFVTTEWDIRHLKELPDILLEICRALEIIPLPRVTPLLEQTQIYIERHLAAGHRPSIQELDLFADGVSGVDYYLERLVQDNLSGLEDVLVVAEKGFEDLRNLLPDDAFEARSEESEITPVAPPELVSEVHGALSSAGELSDQLNEEADALAAETDAAVSKVELEGDEADSAYILEVDTSQEPPAEAAGQSEQPSIEIDVLEAEPSSAPEPVVEAEAAQDTPPIEVAASEVEPEAEPEAEPAQQAATDTDELAAAEELSIQDTPSPLDEASATAIGSAEENESAADSEIAFAQENNAGQDDAVQDAVEPLLELAEDLTPEPLDLTPEEETTEQDDHPILELDEADSVEEALAGLEAAEPAELQDDAASHQVQPLTEEMSPVEEFMELSEDDSFDEPALDTSEPDEAARSDVDEEIVEIFVEEAGEVIATIDHWHPQWAQAVANGGDHPEALAELRRAFHTLKGSGRIVKAEAVGELGWSIENMLNRVVDGTIAANVQFVDLVSEARRYLPDLVQAFMDQNAHDDRKLEQIIERADVLASVGLVEEGVQSNIADVDPPTEAEFLDADANDTLEATATEPTSEQAQLFVDEALRQLEIIEEANGLSPWSITEEMRRAFHTLAGSSSIADLESVQLILGPTNEVVQGFHARANINGLQDFVVDATQALRDCINTVAAGGDWEDPLQLISHADDLLALQEKQPDTGGVVVRSRAAARVMAAEQEIQAMLVGQADLSEDIPEQLVVLQNELLDVDEGSTAELCGALSGALKSVARNLQTDEADAQTVQGAFDVLLESLNALVAGQQPDIAEHWSRSLDSLAESDMPAQSLWQAEDSFIEDAPDATALPELGGGAVFDTASPELDAAPEEELQNDNIAALFDEAPASEVDLVDAQPEVDTPAQAQSEDELTLDSEPDTAAALQPTEIELVEDAVTEETTLELSDSQQEDSWVDVEIDDEPVAQEVTDLADMFPEDFGEELSADAAEPIDAVSLFNAQADDTSTVEVLTADDESFATLADAGNETGLGAEPDEQASTTESVGAADLHDIDMDLVDVFFEEADELLEEIDTHLSDWSGERENRIYLENLLRTLHTLKGSARLCGLSELGDQAHDFETYLIEVQNTNAPIDEQLFENLHQRHDSLVSLVSGTRAALYGTPQESAFESETHTAPSGEQADAPDSATDDGSSAHPNVTAEIRPFKAASQPLNTEQGSSVGSQQEDEQPPLQTSPAQDAAKNASKEPAKERASQEMVRVAATALEDLVNLAGESSIVRARIEQGMADFTGSLDEMETTIGRVKEQLRRLEIETEAQILFRKEAEGPNYDEFDPLEMDRYSQLQQLSKGLSESASDMLDLKDTLLLKARESETLLLQQARINTELQEGLMRTRMVPFNRLLPRLRRIVRQIATEVNKKVELNLVNAEGELDRNLLERMIAPLEHMLRNAVDHGIESGPTRLASGKPEQGRIDLRLSREGGDVVIEISDDGAGVDVDRVRTKAIERELMAPDAQLSDEDIAQFILAPGFSTAQSVTQISGRGVGMDVVNSEVKQLGGSVNIQSRAGHGTKIVVRVPFTVSVNRALMVSVGDDQYAIPLNNIEGIVLLSPDQLAQLHTSADKTFDYAGVPYRVRYLGQYLGREYEGPQAEQNSVPMVLVRSRDHAVAIHVDLVHGSREIVVKSLGPQFAGVGGISGATILGDGSVVVILDLLALVRARQYQRRPAPVLRKTPQTPRCVMVVDDSVTVRKVTSRLLERQGMDVMVAKDGIEAVALLQERKPDVILLDIEMPRMDGFEVARQVRHDERLSSLPIVMISSRTGEKHKQHAKELGVDRFLGKPFQENELLATIDELVKPAQTVGAVK